MSSKSRASDQRATPTAKLDFQRIRVNAEGYDRGGAYWGAGPDVFIASTLDGAEQVTVRAVNLIEARAKAAKELEATGRPVEPADREPIGGHPTRKSRTHMEWRNAITGQTVRLRVTHSRNYSDHGQRPHRDRGHRAEARGSADHRDRLPLPLHQVR